MRVIGKFFSGFSLDASILKFGLFWMGSCLITAICFHFNFNKGEALILPLVQVLEWLCTHYLSVDSRKAMEQNVGESWRELSAISDCLSQVYIHIFRALAQKVQSAWVS